ncbi:helix-turn-helix transcriptional regulator [Nostoc sp. 'Peltigera malacea cyanobiont' DB3992]|uniref:helix-turn-helix transcriptional regulator n=1 Tax=Nostoc sp. 'Peltigera malacea cyanobiont' DB3992 TaxID=1206980 RepID=UPI000C03EAD4|nr:HTH domain-containing protein [Nostoc sp. 'Peltigera malacea cyanobiont' DB3992]PHM09464.1 hypothetical protein CK516_14480 [Nostoc sp. 'Peltigera malacea cyanobiont' DB3992]
MTSLETFIDVDTELLEEYRSEFLPETKESYTSKEISALLGCTDRTVRNYIKKVKEVYYWHSLTTSDSRYTAQCLELIKNLKQAIDKGVSYEDYKKSVWSTRDSETNHQSSLAIIPDTRLITADTVKLQTNSTIQHEQNRFNNVRAMVRQQLAAQAKLDASQDAQIYASTYMKELNNSLESHQNLGS